VSNLPLMFIYIVAGKFFQVSNILNESTTRSQQTGKKIKIP